MSYSWLIGSTVFVIALVAYEFILGYKCYFNNKKEILKYDLFWSKKSQGPISKTELQTIGKYHLAIGIFLGALIENSVILIFLKSCCSDFYLSSKLGTFIMDVYYLDFILSIYVVSFICQIKKFRVNKG